MDPMESSIIGSRWFPPEVGWRVKLNLDRSSTNYLRLNPHYGTRDLLVRQSVLGFCRPHEPSYSVFTFEFHLMESTQSSRTNSTMSVVRTATRTDRRFHEISWERFINRLLFEKTSWKHIDEVESSDGELWLSMKNLFSLLLFLRTLYNSSRETH